MGSLRKPVIIAGIAVFLIALLGVYLNSVPPALAGKTKLKVSTPAGAPPPNPQGLSIPRLGI